MSVSFVKVNDFVANVANGKFNLGSDQLVVALSNTAPGSETHNPTTDTYGALANVTQVSYTNCSTRNITTTSSTQSSGTYKLILTSLVLTASGAVGPFRYIYLYDSATASPSNALIGIYDYGSAVTLASGDTFTCSFDGTNGVLQLAY